MKCCENSSVSWRLIFILMAVFVVNFDTIGFTFASVGVLVPQYRDNFSVPLTTSAWVGSMLTTVTLCVGPIADLLVGRYGSRKVAILGSILFIVGLAISSVTVHIAMAFVYAVVSGFAVSCCNVATMAILPKYFDKRLCMAYAVVGVGRDLASVIFPQVMPKLLESLGYTPSILSLCAIVFPTALFSIILKEPEILDHSEIATMNSESPSKLLTIEEENKSSKDDESLYSCSGISISSSVAVDEQESSCTEVVANTAANGSLVIHTKETPESTVLRRHLDLLKKPKTIIFLVNCLTWNIGFSFVVVLSFEYFKIRGYTDETASYGLTLRGAGSLVGSLFLTSLTAKWSLNGLYTHLLFNFIMSVSLLLLPFMPSAETLMGVLFIYGFCFGIICANLGGAIEHMFGTDNVCLIYGYEMLAGGIGSLIGVTGGAYLQSEFGPDNAFHFGAATCLAGFVCMLFYHVISSQLNHQHDILSKATKLVKQISTTSPATLV